MSIVPMLKSGAVAELSMASFAVSARLFKAMANELKLVDVDIEGVDLSKVQDMDLNAIKNAILQLLGSDQIEKYLFDCMARCTYQGQKITTATFDTEEARGDYLPIALEVIKLNVLPFFKNLDLSSLAPAKPPAKSSPS